MSKQLHERFTREQVLHALDTTHNDCKGIDGCPYHLALSDEQVLDAIMHVLLHLADTSVRSGSDVTMLAFSEGLHFGQRLAELENQPEGVDEQTQMPESIKQQITEAQRNAQQTGGISRDFTVAPRPEEPEIEKARTERNGDDRPTVAKVGGEEIETDPERRDFVGAGDGLTA